MNDDGDAYNDKQVAQALENGRLSLAYGQRTFDILFESVNISKEGNTIVVE